MAEPKEVPLTALRSMLTHLLMERMHYEATNNDRRLHLVYSHADKVSEWLATIAPKDAPRVKIHLVKKE